MNIGAIYSSAQYIVLLNNDTIVGKEWLYPLLKPLLLKDYGCGSPITNNCGNEVKQFLYFKGENTKTNNINTPFDLLKKAEHLQKNKKYKVVEIEKIPFFCAIFKKKDFYEVGMFDINYIKGGWEDDDIMYKLKLKNNTINYYTYGSFVYHMESLSLGFAHYSVNTNRNYYEKKWRIDWIPSLYRFDIIDVKMSTTNEYIKNMIVNNPEKYKLNTITHDIHLCDYTTNAANDIVIDDKTDDKEIKLINDGTEYVLDITKQNDLELYSIIFTIHNELIYKNSLNERSHI
jgi:hypothetical protein